MSDFSPRHKLPFLFVGQSQKEITHNEALAAIDALLHPVIEAVAGTPPSVTSADDGKCWLVDEGATGAWADHADKLACWTGGSWRFAMLPVGVRVRDLSAQADIVINAEGPVAAAEVSDPVGGTVIDEQARQIIGLLLEHLRAAGVLASGA